MSRGCAALWSAKAAIDQCPQLAQTGYSRFRGDQLQTPALQTIKPLTLTDCLGGAIVVSYSPSLAVHGHAAVRDERQVCGWSESPHQIQRHTVGCPRRHARTKKIGILCPYRATYRHGTRKNRPVIGIAHGNLLEGLVLQAGIVVEFEGANN